MASVINSKPGSAIGPERQRAPSREGLDLQSTRMAFEPHHVVAAEVNLTGRFLIDNRDVGVVDQNAEPCRPTCVHAQYDRGDDEFLEL
jgi:hypothetical protein